MKAPPLLSLIFWALLAPLPLFGQQGDARKELEHHFERAENYSEIDLYAESASEWNAAISLAEKQGWDEDRIEASIALAELMRKTWDFERGIELLMKLSGSEAYPKLHLRKLGRIAALYHESQGDNVIDSVRHYLNLGISLAEDHNFPHEEAGLKNELGYLVSRDSDFKQGSSILKEAASLFLQEGDTHNYSVVLVHLLYNHIELKHTEQSDSLIQLLKTCTNGKNWYATEIDFYNLIAKTKSQKGDSLGFRHWEMEAAKSFVKSNNAVHNQRMASFRVLYDTEKFRERAENSELLTQEKEQELEEEASRSRELMFYLSILGLLMLGVIGLLIRERKLKVAVKVANEKYHMLIVESNHRIKNNLQMIISMLEYSSKDLSKTDTRAMKRMSSKIHTISALHKHLYMDVHNERVNLSTYFGEILNLYEELSSTDFAVEMSITKCEIKSERIVYFGLIFNEIISNTIEHNRAENKEVIIKVSNYHKHFLFDYQDHSPRPEGAKEGTGTILIRQLVQRVGGSNFSLDPVTGRYQFEFDA